MTTIDPQDNAATTTGKRRRHRPRRKVVVRVAVVVLIGLVVGATTYLLHGGDTSSQATSAVNASSTATVARRTLSSQTTVNGTLGYGGTYTVINQLGTSNASNASLGNPFAAPGIDSLHSAGMSDAPPSTTPAAPSSTPPPSTTTPAPTPSPTPSPTHPATPPPPPPATRPQPPQQAPPPPARSASGPGQVAGPGNGQVGGQAAAPVRAGAAPSGPGPDSGGGSASGQSSGIVTQLPAVGQVVQQGQVLYRVNSTPVALLYGSIPVYRSLHESMTGADVTELNANLVALGYVTKAELSPTSNEFSSATTAAVKELQDHLGVDQTGTIDLGQVVFLPTAARVTAVQATLGAPINAGAGVLQATSTSRQVTVNLDTSQQSDVKAGDQVTITLPNNKTTPGRVAKVGSVATAAGGGSSGSNAPSSGAPSGGSSGSGSSPGTATVEVEVTLLDPKATTGLDQAPVQVVITTDKVDDALVVPVDALQAKAGGGYAVEVVDAAGIRRQAPVTLGLFDDADGLVQVTGAGLVAGQRVVVPAR